MAKNKQKEVEVEVVANSEYTQGTPHPLAGSYGISIHPLNPNMWLSHLIRYDDNGMPVILESYTPTIRMSAEGQALDALDALLDDHNFKK